MKNKVNRGSALFLMLAAILVFSPADAAATRPLALFGTAIAEKFVRTELYFGRDRTGGAEVSEEEFARFIDEIVTPKFPKGLTVIDAKGQWLADGSGLSKERSKVVIIVYPRKERREASAKIEEIRTQYKKRFAQDSVLRVDMSKSLDVSFE